MEGGWCAAHAEHLGQHLDPPSTPDPAVCRVVAEAQSAGLLEGDQTKLFGGQGRAAGINGWAHARLIPGSSAEDCGARHTRGECHESCAMRSCDDTRRLLGVAASVEARVLTAPEGEAHRQPPR